MNQPAGSSSPRKGEHTGVANPRLARLFRQARLDGPRIALLSTWDVENNAVRILAATLRAEGHDVVEIYFKDWVSNHLAPATNQELATLVRILRREQINLLCISIRASAYAHQAAIISEHVQKELEIAVLWGGMHPTLKPEESLGSADLVLMGEGEPAIADLANRLRDGHAELLGTPNMGFQMGPQNVVRNGLRPLVADLDSLAWRDYTSILASITSRDVPT